jgi:hypothetical protein
MTRGSGWRARAEPATSTIPCPCCAGVELEEDSRVNIEHRAVRSAVSSLRWSMATSMCFTGRSIPMSNGALGTTRATVTVAMEVMAVIRSALAHGVAVEVPPHVDAGAKLVLMPREMPPFFPLDAEGLVQVVEIREGRIVAIRDFIHRDDAIGAAGL